MTTTGRHTWRHWQNGKCILPEKFRAKPRLPKYKDTNKGRNILVYTSQAISKPALKQGFIEPSGLPIRIKTAQRTVNQVRIVPRSNHYVVEVVYPVAAQQADVDPNFVWVST